MLVELTYDGRHTLRREMTEFGLEVWKLMASRGITSQRALSRQILKATGENISFDVVRNYLYGRSAVPPSFPNLLVSALELDEQEMDALAWTFAFRQDIRGGRKAS